MVPQRERVESREGKSILLRPGHETYPVFKEKFPLLVIENAVRWLAAELPKE